MRLSEGAWKNIQGKNKKQRAENQTKAASSLAEGDDRNTGDNRSLADSLPAGAGDAFAFADDTDVDSDGEEPNAW